MKNKKLIAIFCKKDKILSTLEVIKFKFNKTINDIYIYKIKQSNEFLITFNLMDYSNIFNVLPNATIMHTKNGSIFSINALNELIKIENGNVDNNFKINWDNFKDKLIIISKKELVINDIIKIIDKCSLL